MSYTYYQAKNPQIISIQDEHVTESELPERLKSLDDRIKHFETLIDDEITRENYNLTFPTGFYTNSIMLKPNGPNSALGITNTNGQSIIHFWNNDLSTICGGTLTATNITENNKTDIETLQYKTQNIGYENNITSIQNINNEIITTQYIRTLNKNTGINIQIKQGVEETPVNAVTMTNTGNFTFNGNITNAHCFTGSLRTKYICAPNRNDNLVIGRVIDINNATADLITIDNVSGVTNFNGHITASTINNEIITTQYIRTFVRNTGLIIQYKQGVEGTPVNPVTMTNNGHFTFTGNVVSSNITLNN